ncbi:Ran-binding protein 1-like protein c [Hibiscus syriacus]|uniref:Ran-binding protein 1-like protein c n=1 Tax=Hibiscus syriacus TaxID=106335 RepID=A0A6A2XGG2_HIBSY|nr:Ran-binding protein 1-like protein c [Hibiscus syriacus]
MPLELYKEANEEDPKVVLDGVAGLVGLLRQLGDLAEFARASALPPLEKAVMAQTSHIHFAYTVGNLMWIASAKTKETNQWKERGAGTVELLKQKETGKICLVMRQSKTLKIYANHLVLSMMRWSSMLQSCLWRDPDIANGELKDEVFNTRFYPWREFLGGINERRRLTKVLSRGELAVPRGDLQSPRDVFNGGNAAESNTPTVLAWEHPYIYTKRMKSVPFVLVLLVLFVSTEFAAVGSRPLRSSTTAAGGNDEAVAFRVPISANNSGSGTSFTSLAFKLASGPSKKGPGH